MKYLSKIGSSVALIMLIVACKTTQPSFYATETECLGVELDGSQTLKAWGSGRSQRDAVEQAKKIAVRDVLFKGHFPGSTDCFEQPLVLEVNAQEKYADYFNQFFRDGGEYANYVNLKDERISQQLFRSAESRNKAQSKYSVIVRVKRVELKEKLMQDGILKQ